MRSYEKDYVPIVTLCKICNMVLSSLVVGMLNYSPGFFLKKKKKNYSPGH